MMNLWAQKGGEKVSPRRGRPPLGAEPLDIDLKVRVDIATFDELEQYCEDHGVKRAEALRDAIRLLLAQKDK